MERQWFLDKLETVSPAIDSGDVIPVLSHVLFSGTHLLAYNDLIAIQTPLETPFVGALPGGVLRSLLDASSARTIDEMRIVGEAAVEILVGRARLKLAFREAEEFTRLFTMPNSAVHLLDATFRTKLDEALTFCKLSTGRDASRPEHTGITVVPNGAGSALYATSGPTLSRSPLPPTPALTRRVLLPREFCEVLHKLGKDAQEVSLGLHNDHARAVIDGTALFGRLIESRTPLDFDGVFAQHMGRRFGEGFVPIPQFMWKVVERAVIITDTRTERPKSQVAVRDRKLLFDSISDRGEVHDELPIEHGDVSVRVDSRLIHAGRDMFDQIRISESSFMLVKGDHAYMIAANS